VLSSVRGIYFDLDDTLCGYWDASKAALRKTFDDHAPEGVSTSEMVGHWAAAFRDFAPLIKTEEWYGEYLRSGERSRTEQMRLALERVGVQDQAHAERLSLAYYTNRDAGLCLFDDALAVLTQLAPHFPLGLITNGPADIQRQEIETLKIGHFFSHVFIEGEMGEGKPKPGVFRRAEAAMDLQPHQILMVGNSYSHDIRAALENGWHAIWIRRPSDVPPSANNDAKPEEMPAGAPQPTAIINQLSELLSFLPLAS
jgi:putative hydrolase of the HAD superfamily